MLVLLAAIDCHQNLLKLSEKTVIFNQKNQTDRIKLFGIQKRLKCVTLKRLIVIHSHSLIKLTMYRLGRFEILFQKF